MDYFILCIAVRAVLALIAYAVPKARSVLIAFLLVVATAWVLMVMRVVVRDTGPEAGGVIWWKNMRPFHAIMYFLSALFLFHNKFALASVALAVDVGVGTVVRYAYRKFFI